MGKHIFISYNHKQKEWVRNRLVPCLESGGATVLIDYKELRPGRTVVGQMDSTQDRASLNLLVLSKDYLGSRFCRHEMTRAIAKDPDFQKGLVLPVVRENVTIPRKLTNKSQPLYVDLKNDKNSEQWKLLMNSCRADLGVGAPTWLEARDKILSHLKSNETVNLITRGKGIKWKELLDHIINEHPTDLGIVDLDSGSTASRRGLVQEILAECNIRKKVPEEPNDLVVLDKELKKKSHSCLILKHFDRVKKRPQYHDDLFAALTNLVMDKEKLTLIIQSRRAYADLLPDDHPFSTIDCKTVKLIT